VTTPATDGLGLGDPGDRHEPAVGSPTAADGRGSARRARRDRPEPLDRPGPLDRWAQIELAISLVLIVASGRYLAAFVHAQATASLWGDELHSIRFYSSRGPLTTITSYRAANNHVFFNLLNSLTPGVSNGNALRARFWSIAAILAMQGLGLYEFFRRRYFLAGAVLFAVFAGNAAWLNLTLGARGYGLLGFFALASSLWVWRFFEDGRRRWLVAIAIATVLGAWTIPVFVLFAGPLWVLVLVTSRTRQVLLVGLGALVGVVVVYLPIIGDVLDQASRYAGAFGEQFTSMSDVIYTVRTYLLDERTSWLPLVLWGAVTVATVVAMVPIGRWVPTPIRQLSRVLVGSVVAFFALCLIMATTPARTTAFAAVPMAVAGLASVAGLVRGVRRPEVRAGLLAVFAAVAFVVGSASWTAAESFSYVPIENWKGAAEFIEATFPAGTAVYDATAGCFACFRTPNSSNLDGYLDADHPLALVFDPKAFAEGRVAVVSWVIGHDGDPADAQLAAASDRVVEMDLAQQRGSTPPRRIRVLSAPPLDNHVVSASVAGTPAPELTDGRSGWTDPPTRLKPGLALEVVPDEGTTGGALVLVLGAVPQTPVIVRAVGPDGPITLPPGAVTRSASNPSAAMLVVDLPDGVSGPIEVMPVDGPRSRMVVLELWVYPP